MTKVSFPSYRSYEYVEVFKVTERRDGAIYKTKSIGYAHRDRVKAEDEVYASLPMHLLKQRDIELEVL